jgi:hypothetical protein
MVISGNTKKLKMSKEIILNNAILGQHRHCEDWREKRNGCDEVINDERIKTKKPLSAVAFLFILCVSYFYVHTLNM